MAEAQRVVKDALESPPRHSRPVHEPVEGPAVGLFLIPGLTRNLSKRSATKSPVYSFKRGRCHFLNRGLPHSRPPEPDFVPDHFRRARPLAISTEQPASREIFQHASGHDSAHYRSMPDDLQAFYRTLPINRFYKLMKKGSA